MFFLNSLTLEDKGTVLSRNVGKHPATQHHIPVDMSHHVCSSLYIEQLCELNGNVKCVV